MMDIQTDFASALYLQRQFYGPQRSSLELRNGLSPSFDNRTSGNRKEECLDVLSRTCIA
jgi:hypothetical protein